MLVTLPSVRRLTLLVALLVFTNGCYGRHHHRSGDVALAFVAGAAVVAAAESHAPPPEPRVEVIYVNAPSGPPPPSLPASTRDRVAHEDERPAFDAKGARVALSNVDLTPCRAAGAPRGYGHAKVTFIDTPEGLAETAIQCVGNRLGSVTVPEYNGSIVTMGTTWFVP
jgi:hypothetical protein